MAGHSLNTNSQLQCPHGGTVQITTTNTKTKADGAFMATFMDADVITGCPSVPPCVRVQWIVSDLQVKINGIPTLSRSSVGLCLNPAQVPQGQVVVINTQTKVQSR